VTFRIDDGSVDAEKVMREVREGLAEKKRRGLLTDAEVREIAEHPLHPVLEPHDLKSSLLGEVLEVPSRWNFAFDPETVYRSSRGGSGRALEAVRRWLRPVQKLFWNPTPMIAALSRQAELNTAYAHLLHNLTLEVTRLSLEVQDLKHRALQMQARAEFQARRNKTLEEIVLEGRRPPKAE
jgi:hypothetical protein